MPRSSLSPGSSSRRGKRSRARAGAPARPDSNPDRKRLDLLLEERGLVRSRSQARGEILSGRVLVDGVVIDKPGAMVSEGAKLELLAKPRYVSRGGLKLEWALQTFGVDVRGRVALDVGASTGGFTDCLLQHGARRVYALDVGRGLLDWRLRRDERVVVLEGLNARYLKPETIGETVDLATIDISFISLKLVLPLLKAIVRDGGELIPLVKPQFEAGREKVKKGLVRDPRVHLEVLEELQRFIVEELGLSLLGATYSPIKGPKGNIEFFFYLRNSAGRSGEVDLEAVVAAAHAELG